MHWKVRNRKAGRYEMWVCFSSPRNSLKEVSGAVNGSAVAIWAGTRVSPDYGSCWGFFKKEIFLVPGENLLTVSVPYGGTYVSALMLHPLAEHIPSPAVIESSCVKGLRLSADGRKDAAWDVVTNHKGVLYLINRADGRLLASDGKTVFLADGETDGNAQWMRTGEMEDFDYLVHAQSEKVLAADFNGNPILDDGKHYDTAERSNNRAYRKFS